MTVAVHQRVRNINGNSRFYPACQQLTMHTVQQREEGIERHVSSSATKLAGSFSVTVGTLSHVLGLRVKKQCRPINMGTCVYTFRVD